MKIDKDKIITNNTNKESYIINRIYISENQYTTIFDIDRLYTKNEIEENKGHFMLIIKLLFIIISLIPIIVYLKVIFFTQNDLFKGNTPD